MRPGRSVAGRSWDRRISLAPAACPAATFGNATILLYLAVTFAVQRLVVICALAAHDDFRPERGNRPDLTGPERRAAWLVVYPGPGVRHD
jgi:hypothetical protein